MPKPGLTSDASTFYAAQSSFSDPGNLAPLYASLPADPRELAGIARGLMIHRLEGDLFTYAIPEDRLHNDAETRYIDDILRIIITRNDAPLSRRRESADRFVGVCRDFALLHCSFLRHVGVPARIRSGFADYLADGFYVDHVVTEYWNPARGWLLADPELADPLVVETHKVSFDPLNVPRDRFQVAGDAWQRIRGGEADPSSYGVLAGGPLVGEWFVAGNVRLDLASLNKVETLLWDTWGVGPASGEEMTDTMRKLYDGVAQMTTGEVPFSAVRQLFKENDGLRTPQTVTSLAPFNGPSEIALRD